MKPETEPLSASELEQVMFVILTAMVERLHELNMTVEALKNSQH